MFAQPEAKEDSLERARELARGLAFAPRGTVRCAGQRLFRTELARDLGCLLDLDPEVHSWSCLPLGLSAGSSSHVPDFLVERADGSWLYDTSNVGTIDQAVMVRAADRLGIRYLAQTADDVRSGYRLQNARDLLRYARWQCPLGDRIRMLAALEEQGGMTILECFPIFREAPPMPALSALILHRFVEVDLDTEPIGPETTVRRPYR